MDNPLKNNVNSNVMDIQNLDSLRKGALNNDKGALLEVAKQFESLFTNMLMKSMREANAAFETDSPMNNSYTQFYRDMQDKQMASDMSQTGSMGLADVIVRQLSNDGGNYMPASSLNGDSDPLKQLQVNNLSGDGVKNAAIDKFNNGAVDKLKKSAVDNLINSDKATATTRSALATDPEDMERTARFDSPMNFVESLAPFAKIAGKTLNLSPAVILAQAALETGWGQKITNKENGDSSHNLFNIKADKRWDGEKTNVDTLEFKDGIAKREKHQFRSYNSFEASFNDFASFLQNGNRYEGALKKTANPAQFLNSLQEAGYATDPNYAEKIQNILKNSMFNNL